MLTRREWLKWAAAGAAGGFAGCAGVPEECRSGRVDQVAGCWNPKGWALWHGRSRVQAWHPDGYGPTLSITKALAGLAVTKAVAQGKVELDEPLHVTFPEWRNDEAKRRITPRMLLQQTSGLEGGAGQLYRGTVADKGRAALALRVVDAPGTQFRYGPSHWEVLAEFLQRRLGGESLENYLHRSVMRPIGLRSSDWRADGRGRYYLSTGAKMTVEDLGKLGRTLASLLRGNSADGFDAGAFAEVARPSPANPMFGGGLWRNGQAGRGARLIEVEDALDPPRSPGFWANACLSPRHSPNLAMLVGSSGQRVAIWPSQDRVFARLGASRSWQDGPLLNALA
jgi:CubicO group peptidase (beta-lactamase class C family)